MKLNLDTNKIILGQLPLHIYPTVLLSDFYPQLFPQIDAFSQTFCNLGVYSPVATLQTFSNSDIYPSSYVDVFFADFLGYLNFISLLSAIVF